MKNRAFINFLVLGLSVAASSGQTFSTLPPTGDWYPFGDDIPPVNGQSVSQTYGQTFTVPFSGNVLDSWTFDLKNEGSTAVNFQFDLMSWNGSMATGPALYQSSVETVPTSDTSYTAFTVDPDTALTEGGDYVMFINDSGLNTGAAGPIDLGGTGPFFANGGPSSSPLGGAFYFQDTGDTFSDVTSQPWYNFWGDTGFTAYQATFGSGSAPDSGSSLFLMSLGLGGIAALRRRFRRNRIST
jgi:hypothetical protein